MVGSHKHWLSFVIYVHMRRQLDVRNNQETLYLGGEKKE